MVSRFIRGRFPKMSRWVMFLLLGLAAAIFGIFAGTVVGDSFVVVQGAANAAEEADAGPLVFAGIMVFGLLSSLAAVVGGIVGTLFGSKANGNR